MVTRKKKKKFNHPKSINKSISLSIFIFSHSVSILKQELKKKDFLEKIFFTANKIRELKRVQGLKK